MSECPSGFIYWPVADPGRFADACPNKKIVTSDEPLWIVVHLEPEGVSVTGWPGRLWCARVINATVPQGHSGRYVRCTEVELIEELPTTLLFGLHGESIVNIINAAAAMNIDQVNAIVTARHPQADQANTAIWMAWLDSQDRKPETDDYSCILAISDPGLKSQSPVGHSLMVLHQVMFERARDVGGDSAIETDEDGAHMRKPWSTCARALHDAIIAIGAPEFSDLQGRKVLTKAWRTVFGDTL